MDFYGVNMEGPLHIEVLTTKPSWVSTDVGRHIFVINDDTTYVGGNSDWIDSGIADNTAYGVSWNGETTRAPSKNAVYDKIATLANRGVNSDITSMTGLDTNGLPSASVVQNLMQSLSVVDLSDTSTPSILTTAETINTIISNYKSSGADHVFRMPAAHISGNIVFLIGHGYQVDIEPNTGDLFYLNGTAMAVNEHIQNTADTVGETITGICGIINGTYRWLFYSPFSNFLEETP